MKTSDIVRGIAFSVVAALAASALPFAGPASAAEAAVVLKGYAPDNRSAFDLDELAAGGLVVRAEQGGRTVDVDDARDLQYVWDVTPYDTTVAPYWVPARGTAGELVRDETTTPGEFAVPLPANPVSGTYALRARLTEPGDARRYTTVLTVDAGEAEVTIDGNEDGSPLWLDAGADNDVTGSLLLEDGTPLVGRDVDLTYTPGADGGDDTPDAAFGASPVQTAADGTFTGVLIDAPGEGTELGGTVDASSPSTGAEDDVRVDLVSRTLADGSEIVATGLGAGTPGEPLGSTVTVTDPADTPIEGQVVDLSLDHGFFTSAPQAVAGQQVGNLEDRGQTLTALTGEDGEIDALVGIGRDEAFDDDGEVDATLTAVAGDLEDTATAAWSTADSLNGRVTIELAPDSLQENPVGPTVAMNRTYLDVRAEDQFGNRIGGQPIDLSYATRIGHDYSGAFTVSDFGGTREIWVFGDEAGDIEVTGSWDGAPVTTYADGAGTVDATADEVSGSLDVEYYDLDFTRSRFSMTSNPARIATVGSAVTQTVRVLDQMGNPVVGYDVDFFRFGPTPGRGEVRKQTTTNSRGEARYTFVANRVGRSRITAEVTDGADSRTLTRSLDLREPAGVRLTAGRSGPGPDELTVTGPRRAAGAKVAVHRVVGNRLTAVASRRLDDAGRLTLSVPDRNGRKPTTYVVKLRATSTTAPATSQAVTLR